MSSFEVLLIAVLGLIGVRLWISLKIANQARKDLLIETDRHEQEKYSQVITNLREAAEKARKRREDAEKNYRDDSNS